MRPVISRARGEQKCTRLRTAFQLPRLLALRMGRRRSGDIGSDTAEERGFALSCEHASRSSTTACRRRWQRTDGAKQRILRAFTTKPSAGSNALLDLTAPPARFRFADSPGAVPVGNPCVIHGCSCRRDPVIYPRARRAVRELHPPDHHPVRSALGPARRITDADAVRQRTEAKPPGEAILEARCFGSGRS